MVAGMVAGGEHRAISLFHRGQFPHNTGQPAVSLSRESAVNVRISRQPQHSVSVMWTESISTSLSDGYRG